MVSSPSPVISRGQGYSLMMGLNENLKCHSKWIFLFGPSRQRENCGIYSVVYIPASILRKSTSGRHRPVRVADGPMTARYRFT